MTSLQIHIPDSLARKAAKLAEKDHITLDQFASLAVAEKASAWLTLEEMEKRAKRGSRERFLKALSKVPHKEPPEYDQW